MIKELNFVIKSYQNMYYSSDDSVLVSHESVTFSLNPYLTISYNNSSNKVDTVNVGFNIEEYKSDSEGNFVIRKVKKDTTKKYKLPTALINALINVEAAIVEKIFKSTPGIILTKFTVAYDDNIEYMRYQNLNKKFKEYLNNFNYLDIEFETIVLGQSVSRHRMLAEFHKDLLKATSVNEREIQKIFVKFKEVLSLVLLGVDSTLDFEFIVDADNLDINRIDIVSSISLKPKNLIELKRSDTQLFDKNKLYRNNTYSLTKEFSSAIQQTNVQRAHLTLSSNNKFDVVSKSILIIGNAEEEFKVDQNYDLLYYNLEVVRYNNKDITIMTYDQVLKRINQLIR